MTDLPQLQTLLVDAALKRRRRRRVRRAAVPALVAAVCLAAVPWVMGDLREADPEVVAVTPGPPPRVEDAFSLLGRRDVLRVQLGKRDASYPKVFLEQRADRLCLIVGDEQECGAASDYASGHKLLARVVNGRGYVVAPDAVTRVRRSWTGFKPAPFVVFRNLVVFTAPHGAGVLEWTAPDGTRVKQALATPELVDVYGLLGRPQQPGDAVQGMPGARRGLEMGDTATMWLAPMGNAICVVLRVGADEHRGCRSSGFDTRLPLVVAVGGYVAAAVPNRARLATDPPSGGYSLNAVLFKAGPDGLVYTDPNGGEWRMALPQRSRYVLNEVGP